MKTIKIIFLAMWCINSINAQFTFKWGFQIGGSGVERITSIQYGSSGNIYVAGEYSENTDFDPSVEVFELTGDYAKSFIAKYTNNGELVWAKKLFLWGTVGSVHPVPALSLGPNEEIYVTGYKFDGGANIYKAKFDEDGNLIWEDEIDGDGSDYSWGIHSLDNGDFLLLGEFTETENFGSSQNPYELTSDGAIDFFIAKYTNDNQIIWAKKIGGLYNSILDEMYSIRTDSENNIFIAGSIDGSFDFDPENSNTDSEIIATSGDAFITKYNSIGEYLWTRIIECSGKCTCWDLEIDYEDNVIVTGWFSTDINFDPNIDTLSYTGVGDFADAFLAKYTNDNEVQWGFPLGTIEHDTGISIGIDLNNNIHFVGVTRGQTIDLDPSDIVATFENLDDHALLYSMYSSYGKYLDAFIISGDWDNAEWSILPIQIAIGGDQTLIIGGDFTSSNLDIDITNGEKILSADYIDGFLMNYEYINMPSFTLDQKIISTKVYPIPIQCNKRLKIEPSSKGECSAEIIDLYGKVISSYDKLEDVFSPNIPGIYFLLIKSKENEFKEIQKLIVFNE